MTILKDKWFWYLGTLFSVGFVYMRTFGVGTDWVMYATNIIMGFVFSYCWFTGYNAVANKEEKK